MDRKVKLIYDPAPHESRRVDLPFFYDYIGMYRCSEKCIMVDFHLYSSPCSNIKYLSTLYVR